MGLSSDLKHSEWYSDPTLHEEAIAIENFRKDVKIKIYK